jgi:G3E family GTPase
VVVLADLSTLQGLAADKFVGDTVLQQLKDADLIVLNKVDLVDAICHDQVLSWISDLIPSVRVVAATHAQLAIQLILDHGFESSRSLNSSGLWQGGAIKPVIPLQASTLFESFSFEFVGRIDADVLINRLLETNMGLLRAKGVMHGLDGGQYALQMVGRRAEVMPLSHLSLASGRLVVIGVRGQLDREGIALSLRQAGAKLTNDS